MTPKSARKILRKYNWTMVKHQAGVSYAPSWLLRLWKKCTEAAMRQPMTPREHQLTKMRLEQLRQWAKEANLDVSGLSKSQLVRVLAHRMDENAEKSWRVISGN